jgi:hypothetical protein
MRGDNPLQTAQTCTYVSEYTNIHTYPHASTVRAHTHTHLDVQGVLHDLVLALPLVDAEVLLQRVPPALEGGIGGRREGGEGGKEGEK